MTEEEGKSYFYLWILNGKIYEFYLDRFLLDLKLKLIMHHPSYIEERVVVDYKCEKVEKQL